MARPQLFKTNAARMPTKEQFRCIVYVDKTQYPNPANAERSARRVVAAVGA